MEDSTQFDDINKDGIDKFQSVVSELKDKHSVSRTARYCFQYMNYIKVVKMLIYAERTDDQNLHLHAIYKMPNLFAATGHLQFAESARMYLQQMLDLPIKYPKLHSQFAEHG